MREFAKSEIIRQKCSICGSKNKLYTEMVYQGTFYGYNLTCCNCGHIDIFMDSEKGTGGFIRGWLREGKQYCIQLTTCTKKDCPLYGTSKLWNHGTDFESSLVKPCEKQLTDNMCGNPIGSNENSNSIELDINGNKCCKYR